MPCNARGSARGLVQEESCRNAEASESPPETNSLKFVFSAAILKGNKGSRVAKHEQSPVLSHFSGQFILKCHFTSCSIFQTACIFANEVIMTCLVLAILANLQNCRRRERHGPK